MRGTEHFGEPTGKGPVFSPSPIASRNGLPGEGKNYGIKGFETSELLDDWLLSNFNATRVAYHFPNADDWAGVGYSTMKTLVTSMLTDCTTGGAAEAEEMAGLGAIWQTVGASWIDPTEREGGSGLAWRSDAGG